MQRTVVLSGVMSFVMAFLGTVLALALALPVAVGAQEGALRAEQVAVVGDNGADRVRLLGGPAAAAFIQLLDAHGSPRANMGTGGLRGDSPAAAGINLFASGGTPNIARLGTGDPGEGTVMLSLRDQQGQHRIRLRVADDGTPSIELLDPDGTATWSAR